MCVDSIPIYVSYIYVDYLYISITKISKAFAIYTPWTIITMIYACKEHHSPRHSLETRIRRHTIDVGMSALKLRRRHKIGESFARMWVVCLTGMSTVVIVAVIVDSELARGTHPMRAYVVYILYTPSYACTQREREHILLCVYVFNRFMLKHWARMMGTCCAYAYPFR